MILALLEKVLATYVQTFITVLLAGGPMGTSAAQAAAIAAIPAALTVVANGLPEVPGGLPFYVDLTFRTVRTYVVTFLGFVIAVPVFSLDYSIALAASTAAFTACLAVIKGALASKVGNPDSAALLPSAA
jgi:hypothetical protein